MRPLSENELALVSGAENKSAYSNDPAVINCNNGIIGGIIGGMIAGAAGGVPGLALGLVGGAIAGGCFNGNNAN